MIFGAPMRSSLIFSLLISLSGCLPIPARIIETPAIEGSVQALGNKRGSLRIYMLNHLGDACVQADDRKVPSAVTDPEGRFVIPAKQIWSPVRSAVPIDVLAILSLCIEGEDMGRKWAYYSYIRTPEWAPEIRITCYLDKQLDGPIIDTTNEIDVKSTCIRTRS